MPHETYWPSFTNGPGPKSKQALKSLEERGNLKIPVEMPGLLEPRSPARPVEPVLELGFEVGCEL